MSLPKPVLAFAACLLLLTCLAANWGIPAPLFAQTAQSTEASETKPEMPTTVKCGRDSICAVCRRLGVAADPQEVDRQLRHQDVVSFADLRAVLQSKGLHCQALLVKKAHAICLSAVLNDPRHPRAAIAAIPTPQFHLKHFVEVTDAEEGHLLLQDKYTPTPIPYDLARLGDTGIPIMLVGRDATVQTAFEAELRSLPSILYEVSSTPFLTVGLGASMALLGIGWLLTRPVSRRMFAATFDKVYQAASGVYRGWHAQRAFWRYVGGGILLAVALGFLAYREVQPLALLATTVDVGNVPVGSTEVAEIRLINRSFFRTVSLSSVQGSCSCIDIQVENKEIAPGTIATVKAGFMATGPGPSQHSVLITAKEGAQQLVTQLVLHGYDDAKLMPDNFNLGDFPQGVSVEKRFALSSVNYKREQPVKLTVNPPSSGARTSLQVTVAEPAMLESGGGIDIMTRNLAEAPLGNFTQRIVLTTVGDNPRTFVLTANGQIVEPLVAKPNALFFSAGVLPLKQQVQIQARAAPLKIESVSSNSELITCHMLEATETSQVIEVAVAGVPGDVVQVSVKVSQPCARTIEIPIYFSDSTSAATDPVKTNMGEKAGRDSTAQPRN